MPSPAPLQYGEYYHVYNRGNNRENLFPQERNYPYFLQRYAHYVLSIADTYAYCLLRNHFHVLVRILTPEEQITRGAEPSRILNPSQQFSNLFNAYAKAINQACGRTGSLFQHPFGRVHVTSDAHLRYLVVYIHHNPQKHRFVDDFRHWPYSSYHTMLRQRPTHVMRDNVLAWHQGPAGFQLAHTLSLTDDLMLTLAPDDFN